jgi:hypothetical protein
MTVKKLSKNGELQKIQKNRKQTVENIRRKTGNRKIVERRKVGDVIERNTETLLEGVYIAMIIQNLVQ